jgi:F-box and leucine-rich repeat protein GRR1
MEALTLNFESFSLDSREDMLGNLRIIDFTGCTELEDEGIERLVASGPRLRSLTLAKCEKLTDKSLASIGRLGKHLHYLHMGHVPLYVW